MKKALQQGLESGAITTVSGNGLSGRFRLIPAEAKKIAKAEATPTKKPTPKKTGTAKEVTAAKASTKATKGNLFEFQNLLS